MVRLASLALLAGLAIARPAPAQESVLAVAQQEQSPRFLLEARPRFVRLDVARTPVLNRRIAVDLRGATLREALREIASLAALDLAYANDVVPLDRRVQLSADNITVAAALTEVLLDTGVDVVFARTGRAMLVKRPPAATLPVVGTLTGRVTDATSGEPITGAQVGVLGTSLSTTTGDAGRYTIAGVPAGEREVTVRRLGYAAETRRVTVRDNESTTLDLALTRATTRLEEMVTTATGPQRRVEIGHTVGAIQADSLTLRAPITSLSDLISGRLANVQLLAGSGVTGAGGRIRVRGLSSVLLNNDPIVFVDGVRVEAGAPNYNGIGDIAATLGGQRPSRLNDLNPEEIESIEVIKGPSAATLYGTNAANGVINIRTKRGQAGRAQWTVYGEGGIVEQASDFPDSWYWWGKNATTNANQQCFLNTVASGVCRPDSLTRYSPLNDPSRTPFSDGNRSQLGLQVSGGTSVGQRATRYFVSGELENEVGALELPGVERERISAERGGASVPGAQVHPNSLKRTSLRANLNTDLGERAEFGVNAGYLSSRTRLPFDGTFTNGLMLNALQGQGYRNAQDGYLFFRPGEIFAQEYFQDIARFTGGLNASWRPFEWLSTRANGGVDLTTRTNDLLQRRGQGPAASNWREGRRGVQRANIWHYTGDASAVASFTLTSMLSSRTAAGLQYYRDVQKASDIGALRLGPSSETTNGAGTSYQSESTVEAVTFGSYIEQTFGLNERLFLTGAVRADGNSAFGENFRTTYYPKASVSWLLSDEPFASALRSVPGFGSLRLRAAYGASGVQPGALAALRYYQGFTATVNGQTVSAVELAAVGNPDLKPERTTEIEGGIDLSLLEGRVSLEATYYDKESEDALVSRPLAPSLGGGTRLENLGAVENRGWELALTARVLDLRPVQWDVTLSGSRNTNEVVSLGPTNTATGVVRDLPGYPIASLWVRPIRRFDDTNNNGAIDPAEVILGDTAEYVGSSVPTREASLNTTVTLLNGSLRIGAQFDYRGGYYKLNATELNRCFASACRARSDANTTRFDQARAAVASTFSFAGYAEDASFTRFRELSVGYQLPARWASAIRARSALVTLAGRNLALFSDYSGIDPEPATRLDDSDRTRDYPVVPPVRYWIARVTLGF